MPIYLLLGISGSCPFFIYLCYFLDLPPVLSKLHSGDIVCGFVGEGILLYTIYIFTASGKGQEVAELFGYRSLVSLHGKRWMHVRCWGKVRQVGV